MADTTISGLNYLLKSPHKKVVLTNRALEFVPELILAHISLVKLDLRNNRLTQLTHQLSRLSHLAELNLSGNRIQHLARVDQLELPSLRVLHLFNCQIESIGNEFFSSFPNLLQLNLTRGFFSNYIYTDNKNS